MSIPRNTGDAVATLERWGSFRTFAEVPRGAVFYVVDRRVARLFPDVDALTKSAPRLLLTAGESAKTILTLGKILAAATFLPRGSHLVAVGGGTVGDVATVAAHLVKRGVHLVQVPTTLLAAVDSSLGGKGAIDLEASGRHYKNAAGVFHYAQETWIDEAFFTTLKPAQIREGLTEAWKMIVCLDAKLFDRYATRPKSLVETVRDARRLKSEICARDPYETKGVREVLNFGHTIGHVVESLSRFRVAHGDAVGLGIRAALDIGRLTSVTPEAVAERVESALTTRVGILTRKKLGDEMRRHRADDLFALLLADKKNRALGEIRMVLLERPGKTRLVTVPRAVFARAIPHWQAGTKP